MAFPPKKRPMDDDPQMGALSSLMAEGSPEEEAGETPDEEAGEKDPMSLVAEIEQKLEELKAAVA